MGYPLDPLGSLCQILDERKNVGSPCRLHDAVEGHSEPQRFIIRSAAKLFNVWL